MQTTVKLTPIVYELYMISLFYALNSYRREFIVIPFPTTKRKHSQQKTTTHHDDHAFDELIDTIQNMPSVTQLFNKKKKVIQFEYRTMEELELQVSSLLNKNESSSSTSSNDNNNNSSSYTNSKMIDLLSFIIDHYSKRSYIHSKDKIFTTMSSQSFTINEAIPFNT